MSPGDDGFEAVAIADAAGVLEDQFAQWHPHRQFVDPPAVDMAADAEQTWPRALSVPIEVYHSAPCATICSRLHNVSTLLITVGQP